MLKFIVSVVFALLVLALYLLVMRTALVRINRLVRVLGFGRPVFVTIALASIVMEVLTVFGTSVLEYTAHRPDWHSVLGWNCVIFLVTVFSLAGAAAHQVKRHHNI